METMSQAESGRLYSWWWDSHISPKSSKWLQDNLTVMDIKVKAMLKLIEEDADSFAQRAEMYYEKRPELIKLVEEFYRGYRALAERLDQPNGELYQAHRFEDLLSNTSPFVYTENFSFFSSHNEEDSHTPDIPHPWHPLFEPDIVQKDAVVNTVPSQVIRRKGTHSNEWIPFEGNKGLKQLCELVRIGNGEDDMKHTEAKVSTSWNVHERQKRLGYKGKHWFEGKEKPVCKAESLQDNFSLRDDVSQVSTDDLHLFATIAPGPKSTSEAELKYQNLQEAFSELQVEKEMVSRGYQDCLEKITNLENEIICAKEESKKLKGEIHMGLTKLNNAEERYHLIENKYLTFQCEMEILLYNLQFQSEEEKNNLQLELEYTNKVLNDMDIIRKSLEDEIHQIKEENARLKERNISSSLLIGNLNHEVLSLKENKINLEEELFLLTQEKEFLQLELNCVKEELESLHGLKEDLTETVRILGLNAGSVCLAVKNLQDENVGFKETICKLLQKNALQEISLFKMDGHCEELRGNLRELDGRNQTLIHENSFLIAENGTLVSKVQNLVSDMDKLLQDRISSETSLVTIGIHCEEMRGNLLAKDHYCQLLLNEKCNLLNENHVLVSQAESLTHCLLDMENRYLELKASYSYIEEEKTLALQQVDTLKAFTKLDHQIYEEALANSKTSTAKIGNQLLLSRENQLIKRELDEVKSRVVNADVGSLILECVIHDLRERNVSLLDEIQTQSKELAYVKVLLSEMNNENSSNQAKIKALLQKKEKTKMELSRLVTLLKVDGTDTTGGINEFGDLIQKVLKKVKNTQISLMDAKDEIDQKTIEGLIYITFLDQLRLEPFYLNKKTSNVEDEICTILYEMLALENITLIFKNSLFEKSMEDKSLKENLDCVSRDYSDLEKVIGLMNKRMQINLTESLEKLDEDNKKIRSLEDELKGVRCISQKMKQQVQEICKLLEYNHHKRNREVEFLHKEREKSEAEVSILHKEIEEFRINEQHLTSQLTKRDQDAEQWDSEAATFYFDLQNSVVQATFFQEKVRDLARECESLKQYSFTLRRMLDEERQSHNACVKGMKKELTEVREENRELRLELEAYLPLVLSVRDDIASLLEQSLSASKNEAMENKETQLAHESISNQFKKSNSAASFGIVELRNLKPKIKAIERMIKDHRNDEVFHTNPPIKSKWGLSIKDIPLDPVSNNSFSGNTEEFSFGSLSGPSIDVIHRYRGKSEELPGKDSVVDKLEVSSKSSIPEEYTRLIEILNYDDDRLMDLQTSIGSLKRKMEKSSKKNDPTGFEYNTVKEHLKEVELTVLGLIERTRRWMKKAKDLSSDPKLKSKGSEEARILLRRQLSARVRRGYETIGKLEMEVERIEFVLLKLEGDHGERIIKGKNIRTALSDYLYGRKEISRRTRYAGYVKPVANFC